MDDAAAAASNLGGAVVGNVAAVVAADLDGAAHLVAVAAADLGGAVAANVAADLDDAVAGNIAAGLGQVCDRSDMIAAADLR